jgi:hypothetical protein
VAEKLPTYSRIQALKAEINAIANVPKANELTAAKCVTALLACYPGQQNQDERVASAFVQQLKNLCTGVDVDVLQKLIDAGSSASLVRKHKWLPTISEVGDFIESRMEPKRVRIGFYLDEIAVLKREAEPQIPTDERQRRAQRLRDTATVIRQTARALEFTAPAPFKQMPEMEAAPRRLAALAYLEAKYED